MSSGPAAVSAGTKSLAGAARIAPVRKPVRSRRAETASERLTVAVSKIRSRSSSRGGIRAAGQGARAGAAVASGAVPVRSTRAPRASATRVAELDPRREGGRLRHDRATARRQGTPVPPKTVRRGGKTVTLTKNARRNQKNMRTSTSKKRGLNRRGRGAEKANLARKAARIAKPARQARLAVRAKGTKGGRDS